MLISAVFFLVPTSNSNAYRNTCCFGVGKTLEQQYAIDFYTYPDERRFFAVATIGKQTSYNRI